VDAVELADEGQALVAVAGREDDLAVVDSVGVVLGDVLLGQLGELPDAVHAVDVPTVAHHLGHERGEISRAGPDVEGPGPASERVLEDLLGK
jgi:hypothetical protein